MGYYTYINGTITLKSGRACKIIKCLIDDGIEVFDDFRDNMTIQGMEIEFEGEIKPYENELEKLAYFILKLDEKAKGEISCEGENRDDNWKVILENGSVNIYVANMSYEFNNNFSDEKVDEKVKKILNDKGLNKKILVNNL